MPELGIINSNSVVGGTRLGEINSRTVVEGSELGVRNSRVSISAFIELKLKFGGQIAAPAVSGWVSVWGEANPINTTGVPDTVDYTRTEAGFSNYGTWNDLGGTGIGIRAINGANVANKWGKFGGTSYGNTGQSTGANSGVYPDNVLVHLWFVNRAAGDVKLELYNVPAGTYTVTLMGSRDSAVGGSRIVEYRVNGGTGQTLECIGNTATVKTFTGISPASGVIDVRLLRNNNDFTYINSLILTQTA